MASEIYYGENLFVIRTIRIEEWLPAYWSEPVAQEITRHIGISYPNQSVGDLVRNVEVQLNVDIHLENFQNGGAKSCYSDWKYLLVEKEDEEDEYTNEIQWQKCFQQLRYLRVVLDFNVYATSLLQDITKGVEGFDAKRELTDYRTLLHAEVVEVAVGEFTGEYSYADAFEEQAQRCAEDIVAEIRPMIYVRSRNDISYRAWKKSEVSNAVGGEIVKSEVAHPGGGEIVSSPYSEVLVLRTHWKQR